MEEEKKNFSAHLIHRAIDSMNEKYGQNSQTHRPNERTNIETNKQEANDREQKTVCVCVRIPSTQVNQIW